MSSQHSFTNRLARETSPYLRQHAHNPVDWYPWGEEALARARQLDRPIFLSIGYSACHWCHVMEHESFEDPEIGKVLNDHFVSIKVDREERPDLDQIYMAAVQLLTRQGGWPMSMFLTPGLKPFFGGTYFPPDNRYGRPSFRQVLDAVLDAWQSRREAVEQQAGELTQHVQMIGQLEPGGALNDELLRQAARRLARAFDPTFGGFGSAPKFPHALDLGLLLRVWQRFGDDHALKMVRKTLDMMALGGIYDHLGGGFHRYSTDARWLAPHFEKMLYDNALLTTAYLEGYQATGDSFYKEVVEETLAYVLREMTSPQGPFFSTQDADSEGEEGKFFVWSWQAVQEVLGPDLGRSFGAVYDVTPDGNWEGHNILHRSHSWEQSARLLGKDVGELRMQLAQARRQLFEVRSGRVWPGRDEKVLTSWNGLMIDALARAAQVLDRPEYAVAAARAADFLLTTMRTAEGRLYRTWSAGSEPKLNGYLEDYAFLINALISLYEATFAPRWLEAAQSLTTVLLEQFWDEAEGGFFYTAREHESLIARTRDPHDSSVPSGNSVAVTALLRLAKLTGRSDLLDRARRTLLLFSGLMAQSPQAAGQMLIALDFFLGPVDEVVIAGAPQREDTRAVLRLLREQFRPLQVVALQPGKDDPAELETVVPLVTGKLVEEEVTLYLCRDFTCHAPAVGLEAARKALRNT
jgi:uncharacterized protein YyaL (SSP411 family)